jgi:hypothetical protein
MGKKSWRRNCLWKKSLETCNAAVSEDDNGLQCNEWMSVVSTKKRVEMDSSMIHGIQLSWYLDFSPARATWTCNWQHYKMVSCVLLRHQASVRMLWQLQRANRILKHYFILFFSRKNLWCCILYVKIIVQTGS